MPRTAPDPRRLTPAQARRVAVAASGLGAARSATGGSPATQVTRCIRLLGVLQIDSVNVLARAHHLTLISRLGVDPAEALAAATRGRRRTLFEYWGREASLLPVETQPLWRWRMDDARTGKGIYNGLKTFRKNRRAFVDAVLNEIRDGGPRTAAELSTATPRRGSWWGWSDGKRALEWLFWAGLVTAAERRGTFERVYDLPERVLPQRVLDAPTPARDAAQRDLIGNALRARGIATEPDLRDALRLKPETCRARLAELAEDGAIRPVTVPGWPPAWAPRGLRVPTSPPRGAVLVNPFDPLIACRERTERLFGMRYRIEIYVPAERRVHGYYVLPLLWDDRLVARVDLKADRPAGLLRVRAAHHDAGEAGPVAGRLAAALRSLARTLGLDDVRVERRGGLASRLRAAVNG